MDCHRACEVLWPVDRPRLAEEDVVEATRHLEGCEVCGRTLAYDRSLLETFERLRRDPPPRELREAVYDAVARARAGQNRSPIRSGSRRRASLFVAGSAVVVAAAVWAGILGTRPRTNDIAAQSAAPAPAFMEDYIRRAVREDRVASSDPALVRQFLTRELGFDVELPVIPGFAIDGAEVCLLDGVRGAMVVYRGGRKLVSYYALPARSGRARPPEASADRLGAADGSTMVVGWASEEAEFALVGPLSPDELIRAARGVLGR